MTGPSHTPTCPIDIYIGVVIGVSKLKTVLFVCVHNAGRSQMAEALFNTMTKGRHRGISAGSQPSNHVNPNAVKAMNEIGIDISGGKPKKLTGEMVEAADKVIIMGCGEEVCPVVPKEIEDWQLEDPEGKSLKEVRAIRDQIKERVTQLIETLES